MVVRKRKERNFTTLDNGIFKDKNLSMGAKGLLCILLSLPDDWKYSISGLASLLKDGKDAVRSSLNELEEHGYFKREERRDGTGHFKGYDYIIFEDPMLDAPMLDEPMSDEPMSENPTSVKPPLLNTNTLNKEELNTKKSKETVQDVISMLPDELKEVAESFVEHRKALKAPMTGNALKLAIRKAKKYANDDMDKTIAIMEQSIENGWKGIFELKEKREGRNDWIDRIEYDDV